MNICKILENVPPFMVQTMERVKIICIREHYLKGEIKTLDRQAEIILLEIKDANGLPKPPKYFFNALAQALSQNGNRNLRFRARDDAVMDHGGLTRHVYSQAGAYIRTLL
jgi:hypothetical protein